MEFKSSKSNSTNQAHESLVSASTTTNAIGSIWLLPSFPTAAKSWPPYIPFKKHPSNPIRGLQVVANALLQAAKHTYILSNTGPSAPTVLLIMTVDPGLDLISSSP